MQNSSNGAAEIKTRGEGSSFDTAHFSASSCLIYPQAGESAYFCAPV